LFSCGKNELLNDSGGDSNQLNYFLKTGASADEVVLGGAINLYAFLQLVLPNGDISSSNYSSEATFFVDGVELSTGSIFYTNRLGKFKIKAFLKRDYWEDDISYKSKEIEITVIEARNKKTLLEYYTSRRCGFCPCVGYRVDSLNKSNNNVIGYAIHGSDELEITETHMFEEYQQIYGRPTLRIDRGFFGSNSRAPQEITDSIDLRYGNLAPLELSIQSRLDQNQLEIKVFGKFYQEIFEELRLSVMVVEDDIITFNQYNSFGNPWCSSVLPAVHPIPEYVNHNVLRMMLTEIKGDQIIKESFNVGMIQEVGSFQVTLDNINNIEKSSIIAFVHRKTDNVKIPSVLNAQIVKLGERIDFFE